jgi:hypothetical protein
MAYLLARLSGFTEVSAIPRQDHLGLEHGPTDGGGKLDQPGFLLADVIDSLGEQLDDVEPVNRDGSLREGVLDRGQEGRRHVADWRWPSGSEELSKYLTTRSMLVAQKVIDATIEAT